METTQAAHPTSQQLAALALGKLAPQARDRCQAHVAGCAACREFLSRTSRDELTLLLQTAGAGRSAAEQSTPAAQQSRATQSPVTTPPLVKASLLDAPAADDSIPLALRQQTKYRIVRLLGRGGMGSVYEAYHEKMERRQALKVINPELVDNPQALLRFEAEVKAVAKLDHPNIARAFDAESFGPLQAIVMEFVPGQTLYDFLKKRGRLSAIEACRCIRQACLGLQHAHERGLVHRDLKPQNLMLTQDKGIIKILDFGLAKIVSENQGGRGLTRTNMTMGTYEYCAPEQALDAASADIRADIYSLGCTIYYLIAGVLPFAHNSDAKLLMAHQHDTPAPLCEVRPDAPQDLSDLIARMLAKDPADRPQTPADVAKALLPFAKGEVKSPAADVNFSELPTAAIDGGLAAVASKSRKHLSATFRPATALLKRLRKTPKNIALAGGGAAAFAALILFAVIISLRTPDGRETVVAMQEPPTENRTPRPAPTTEPARASPTHAAASAIQAALKSQSSESWYNQPLQDVIEKYRNVYHIEIRFDPSAETSKTAPIVNSCYWDHRSLELGEALNGILEPWGLSYETHDDFLLIKAEKPTPPPQAQEALTQPVAVEFAGVTLRKVLEYLRSKCKVEIQANGRAWPWLNEGAVTMNIQTLALSSALHQVLEPLGLTYWPRGDYILITHKWEIPLPSPPLPARDGKMKDALKATAHFAFCETPIETVVHFLKQRYGISIRFDDLARRDIPEQCPISLYVARVSLASALELMFEPVGVTYEVRDDYVLIKESPAAEDSRKLRNALESTITLNLSKMPLRDIVDGLKKQCGCDIRFSDQVIPTLPAELKVNRLNLRDTLGTLLAPLDLYYERRNDYLFITRMPKSATRVPFAIAPFNSAKAKEYQEVCAKGLGLPVVHTSSIGMQLIFCPPGSFMMGSPAEEKGRITNEDQVSVVVGDFYLGEYSVTQAEFRTVMGSSPWGGNRDAAQGDEYPAVYINWNDATDFCRNLTARESQADRLPKGYVYALPTEAQWEYSCRAGSTSKYCFGDEESRLGEYSWYNANSGGATHAVGGKKPNAWGFYDMHGNVVEWCRDYYAEIPPGGEDPFVGTGSDRVVRGVSWYGDARNYRSARRSKFEPGHRSKAQGFRVALVRDYTVHN